MAILPPWMSPWRTEPPAAFSVRSGQAVSAGDAQGSSYITDALNSNEENCPARTGHLLGQEPRAWADLPGCISMLTQSLVPARYQKLAG